MHTLETLSFDNTYARLPDPFYAKASPRPLKNPFLVAFNPDAAALIDLGPDQAQRPEFVAYVGGAKRLPGSNPLAMRYAGHQFGHYVPILGDGRAVLLGEVRHPDGSKQDLHLKGSGLTPFSRDDDGRAVLRSTIREYLCSEAMQALGIPTTRALCIIGSEEPVHRERVETGAMLLRLSPSHVRFGTFEYVFYAGRHDLVRTLADYVIEQLYPRFAGDPAAYARLFHEVAVRTARLLAQWQAVGFAHGVMNTDNMSILGLTLDYGPFGFLDEYDPGLICNHSDRRGRYAFGNQPDIAYFNLRCLAQALSPLITSEEAQASLDSYETTFAETHLSLMRTKLGLRDSRPEDGTLVEDLLRLLQVHRVDYTVFFRALGEFRTDPSASDESLRDLFVDRATFDGWAGAYRARLRAEQSRDDERRDRMNRVNPKYVLRNYLAHQAILQATERQDFTQIARLHELLRDPYTEHPGLEAYAAPSPNWGKQLVISCSS